MLPVFYSIGGALYCTPRIATQRTAGRGISCGAVMDAAIILAKQPENSGKNIVVLLTNIGKR